MARSGYSNGRLTFFCEECGFGYATEELAEKCRKWCAENNSCSLEVTKHALMRG